MVIEIIVNSLTASHIIYFHYQENVYSTGRNHGFATKSHYFPRTPRRQVCKISQRRQYIITRNQPVLSYYTELQETEQTKHAPLRATTAIRKLGYSVLFKCIIKGCWFLGCDLSVTSLTLSPFSRQTNTVNMQLLRTTGRTVDKQVSI